MSHVSAAQAETYYQKEDYYTQDLTSEKRSGALRPDAVWFGKGAVALGLTGEFDAQTFKILLYGKAPDGYSLHAKPIDPDNHRAATDYTFSAPKSVSIAALIQGDEWAIAAHDQAVETALSVLESRYSQARITTDCGRQRIHTENIAAALFRHETSREQDPQLHTHCVVLNTTQLEDGTWRSLSNEEIIANQKLLGEIYQNELAYLLREAGYEIEVRANGQFDLRGYDPDLLDQFSTRSQQIQDYLHRWEQNLEEAGGVRLHAKQRKQATLNTRQSKRVIPREVLRQAWAQTIQTEALRLPSVPTTECDLSEESRECAVNRLVNAIAHASEREAVFRRSKLERFVLENHLGQQRLSDLTTALSQSSELIAIDGGQIKYTTQLALYRERETLRLVKEGQRQVNAIVNLTDIEDLFERHSTLTQGQRQAIELSLMTCDRVIAWQGVAGSGKTHSLKLVAELSRDKGYRVRGFAPSAAAATILGHEAQIESSTVASLLLSDSVGLLGKEIWIVDEAGLLSAKDAHQLLQRATEQQARVILVGDTRQLSAVEAGNPFRSLQRGGIAIAYLDESLRQKTVALRDAVTLMAAGEMVKGLEMLDTAGSIQELNQDSRFAQIVQDYLELSERDRNQTLLLTTTNQERLELTAQLRQALQEERQLGGDQITIQSLRPKDLTTAQVKYAHNYEVGDILVPLRAYKAQKLEKNGLYTVVEIDADQNQLALRAADGQVQIINPAHGDRKRIYTSQNLKIAVGEQLRWTKNDRTLGIQNGQPFRIEHIDGDGNACIRDDQGETRSIQLQDYQYIDYAWVNTVYSSQGKTADRVWVSLDQMLSRELLYVATSRAKHDFVLYTSDLAALFQQANTSRAKENVSDYIPLFQLVNSHAQTSQIDPASDLNDRRDLGERVGSRVNRSFAADLSSVSDACSGELGVAATISQLSRSANQLDQTLARLSQPHFNSASPTPKQLESGVERVRERTYAESLVRSLGRLNDVLEDVAEQFRGQHQLAAESLRLFKQVEPILDQRQRRQRALLAGDYGQLWQEYSRGLFEMRPARLESLVTLRCIADSMPPRDILHVLWAGSHKMSELQEQLGADRATQVTARKVKSLIELSRALQVVQQSSDTKEMRVQPTSQAQEIEAVKRLMQSDGLDYPAIVGCMAQSQRMQQAIGGTLRQTLIANPEPVWTYLLEVITRAQAEFREQTATSKQMRPYKTGKQKRHSQGFEME